MRLSIEAEVTIYDAKVEPSLFYGNEVWILNVQEGKRVQAVEINCKRNICGAMRIKRVRNEGRRSGRMIV